MISTEELLFRSRYFCNFRRTTFWRKLIFQKSNIPHYLFLLESYLFRGDTFSKDLIFQSSYLFRRAAFSEELLFHSCTSSPQLHFLFISQKLSKPSTGYAQLKCGNSFLCIYNCSKSDHRQGLFKQLVTQSPVDLLLFDKATFLVSYFFRASIF